ncbi:hypothetical protein L0P88_06485 [Muricauda sp. SCSIO 64092]|uniref:hypothetical protein n=1 Tax=Allomuricauda sp. SCSIO 64092 TaxID=2908842 RepID=UPI001FF4DA51|nr:hypothetical protein [Muricauda sp. SCSIO 64092]UOY08196.1 hypothetical protein L0P88_06485 [Muricauda sp. SCSIO 64092]
METEFLKRTVHSSFILELEYNGTGKSWFHCIPYFFSIRQYSHFLSKGTKNQEAAIALTPSVLLQVP